jgi:plasmid stabilization system protein ParE
VPTIRIQERASHRLDDIYRYTHDRWGDSQAEKYINGLFAAFDKIAGHRIVSKPVPAEFGVNGFFFRFCWTEVGAKLVGMVQSLLTTCRWQVSGTGASRTESQPPVSRRAGAPHR